MRLKVLDEKTGNKLTFIQSLIRYIGYIPSILVFCIGLIWVAFDAKNKDGMTRWRKQWWLENYELQSLMN